MLPPPSAVRAVVVGIEEYPGLGSDFRVPRAAAAAADFAHYLVHECNVERSAIDLWLAPIEAFDADRLCNEADLAGVRCRRFEWEPFRAAMDEPEPELTPDTFLMVYYCGHGAVKGVHNAQHLVLPQATTKQFRCIDLENWRAYLSSGAWAACTHQLWIIDACRHQWGIEPAADNWEIGPLASVRRCLLSSCAQGEVMSVSSTAGPRYTRELLNAWREDAGRPWPDFYRSFEKIAAQLRNTGAARQSPTVLLENWNGAQIHEDGSSSQQLEAVLEQIGWSFEKFLPYIMRAQAMSPPGFPVPRSLKDGLRQLTQLAPVDGIEPIDYFAARVADISGSSGLRSWVEAALTPRQKAELAARLGRESAFVRLSLWYRSDSEPPTIEGQLDVIDAGSGVQPWPRRPGKSVSPGTEVKVMGQWVQEVFDHLGLREFEMEVELFLPSDMLANANFDIDSLPLPDNTEIMLGQEWGTVLRCADRYKGGTRLQALRRVAPAILARHGQAADPLRWARRGEDPAGLVDMFKVVEPGAPVWLGFEHGDAETLMHTALRSGLPAVIWLRSSPDRLTQAELHVRLHALLACALNGVPAALKQFRCAEQDEAARTVAVLLDDPARIPDIFVRLRQPGE